jgi:hypothetical protein
VVVEFGDGEECVVKVRAWAMDRRGRQVLDVEWFAAGGAWQGSYIVDPARMREPG